jgi:predicted CXXCH cytochrome family protein
MKTSVDSCVACHKSDPVKDAQGNFTTQNHYGTRDFFASKHAQGGTTNCLTCHGAHKANASGNLLTADKPNDVCVKCHAGSNYDIEKLMWKNPTDPNNHITRDHSFGAMKYEDLGDDPATKPVEIKNPAMVDLIKKLLPDLAK